MDEIERFEAKINKAGPNGCWLWTASTINGYGQFGKGKRAHRFSYRLYRDQIPNGLCVLHRCDNPLCVNPDHLFLGTRIDNNLDRDKKGRTKALSMNGERNSQAKLSNAQADAIRADNRKAKIIANEYGVHFSLIYRIRQCRTYRAC